MSRHSYHYLHTFLPADFPDENGRFAGDPAPQPSLVKEFVLLTVVSVLILVALASVLIV